MRVLINGIDLLMGYGTYLLKAYSTDHYAKGERTTLYCEKAIPWIQEQLKFPNRKVVIYQQDRVKRHRYGKKRWVKLTEVCS